MLQDEQTWGERLVLRTYLGVLWFGTIFFYVSVPAMVLLSLAVGIGLVLLMLTQLSHIPVKIVAILFIAGVGGTWAVLRGLFLRASAGATGKEITEADEPGLFAALREVSEVACTRMVDRVYLELGSEVAVRESGGGFRVLLGGGKRVLHLGYWALHGLTVSELKSVLAHEYGHFSHGETRLTPAVTRIVNTVVGMLQRMAALGGSTLVNPVHWYLRIFYRVFLATTSGHSRRRELLADRAAALAYGGDVFGNALRRVVENGVYFGRRAGNIAVLLRASGRPCTAIYRALEASSALTPPRLRDEGLRQVLDSKPETFDSHPPPSDRIARVAGVRGTRPEEASPAYSLLRDAGETSQLLAGILQERIDAQLAGAGQASRPSSPMDAGAQVLFAEGLELHDSALALQELDDPASDGLFASSVERLEAALGAKDPLLVAALENLARSQQRLGRKAEAQATLNRAVGIVAEHPDVAEERALRELMKELAAA
jgi:Zn-dependent protease with chaperone function